LSMAIAPMVAMAQLLPRGGGVPAVPNLPQLPVVAESERGLANAIDRVAEVPRVAARLADDRLRRIEALVRANPDTIALDEHGNA
ncbi:hypothetical protein AAER41_01390, partial [Pseudomonas aeruginosa]